MIVVDKNRMNMKKEKDREYILTELLPGDEAVIVDINNTALGKDRLCELGLTSGTPLRVVKFAPLGDPMEIKIRGYHLSIRNSMAKEIRVRHRCRHGRRRHEN
ncbi:MAG: ferrous iron transport protein A [Calditrichaceae bacterium]|nr:ferrous iron transport protein A [Calditrichaceae bacterium]